MHFSSVTDSLTADFQHDAVPAVWMRVSTSTASCMEGVIELKYGLPRSKLYSILAASWPQLLKEVVLLSGLEKMRGQLEDDDEVHEQFFTG